MPVKRELLVGVLLVGISTWHASTADTKPLSDMKAEEVARLKVSTAELDAKNAVAHGDKRLLAVYGLTVEVPGVQGDVSELRAKYGLRILEGTSDAIKGPSDRVLNQTARNYAARYNQTVVSESAK